MENRLHILMYRITIWVMLLGSGIGALQAQNFEILDLDNSSFPQITLKIRTLGYHSFELDSVVVTENEVPQAHVIENIDREEESPGFTYTGILIESSYYAKESKILTEFKKGISTFFDSANYIENRKYGVFQFNFARRAGNALQFLSDEFSSDVGFWGVKVNEEIKGVDSSSRRRIDLLKAIFESLEVLQDQGRTSSNKFLVVIATGIDNGKSPITPNSCIEKSKLAGVKVYAIGFRNFDPYAFDNLRLISSETGGKFYQAKNSADIVNALQDIKEDSHKILWVPQLLTLSYTSKHSRDTLPERSISVSLGTQTQSTMYQPPEGEAPAPLDTLAVDSLGNEASGVLSRTKGEKKLIEYKYLWVIGAILCLLGLYIGGRIWIKGRKKYASDPNENPASPVAAEARLPGESIPLMDRVEILPESVSFQEPPAAHRTAVGSTAIIGNETDKVNPYLMVVEGNDIAFVPLEKNRYIIGRSPQSDIVLNDPTVSKKHALISLKNGQYHVKDLSSKNGTLLNQRPVNESSIKLGDVLTVGKVKIEFQKPLS